MTAERVFARTIGIDYSGRGTPETRTSALQVYSADKAARPQKITPEGATRWNRRGIAEWLVDQLGVSGPRTLVGIDHAFSFPICYFQEHNLLGRSWDDFLNDFQKYWPTDVSDARVSAIRSGMVQNRTCDSRWRRVTEKRTAGAKSVFLFNVPGSVAHSTHAGLPWLRYIRRALEDQVHFWPFDGWEIRNGKSVIAEVYPSLWSRRFDPTDRTSDEHDAYSIAAWLSHADQNGWLPEYFTPNLSQEQRQTADKEGWILGTLGYIHEDAEEAIRLMSPVENETLRRKTPGQPQTRESVLVEVPSK